MGMADAVRLFDVFEGWARAGRHPRLTDDEVLTFLNKEPFADADIAAAIERLNALGQRIIYAANLLQTLAPGRTPLAAEALADYRAAQIRVLAKVRWQPFFGMLGEACEPMGQPNCHGDRARPSHPFARGILRQMGLSDNETQHCVDFFREHGGHCDCEILFDVIDLLLPPGGDGNGGDRGPSRPRPHAPTPRGDKQPA